MFSFLIVDNKPNSFKIKIDFESSSKVLVNSLISVKYVFNSSLISSIHSFLSVESNLSINLTKFPPSKSRTVFTKSFLSLEPTNWRL